MASATIKKREYKHSILSFFTHRNDRGSREALKIMIKKSTETFRGVPIFMYRFPLFAVKGSSSSTPSYKGFKMISSQRLSPQNLEVLEYLFVNIKKEDSLLQGTLSGKFNIYQLEREFGDEARELLYQLVNVSVSIFENMDYLHMFKIVESLDVDENTGEAWFTLSTKLSMMYYCDYRFNILDYRERISKLEHPVSKIAIRYALSLPELSEKGVKISTIFESIGFDDYPDVVRQITQKFLPRAGGQSPLSGMGIMFDNMNQKFIPVKDGKYPGCMAPYFDMDKVYDFDEADDSADGTRPGKYIDFDTLVLDGKMKQKAFSVGFKEEQLEDIFTMFKNVYSQSDKNYTDVNRTWASFLSKQPGYINGKDNSVPNMGAGASIQFTKEMEDIAIKYGLSSADYIDQFTLFRNHYHSSTKKQNWLRIWENWIIRNKQYQKEKLQSTNAIKDHVEMEFYLAQLVSDDIKRILMAKGVSPKDVIDKKTPINGIGFDSYSVPPRMGGGKTNLFFWTDKGAQERALANYKPAKKEELDGSKPIAILPHH